MKRILIAEDSPTQARALTDLLESAGYGVVAAANGREALALVASTEPDLVITDVAMPEMDGHELCQAIKGSPGTAGTPVVMITVTRGPEEIVKGLLSGADNFIPKPYDDGYLLERVRRIFDHLQLSRDGGSDSRVTLNLDGRSVTFSADKQQILELLLATSEELGRANWDLQQKERDLKATLTELRAAKDEADAANRAKSEFLSRMSHELRTPLNSVMGFGQLLAMEDLPELQVEAVEHILAGGQHLLELINEVLDIARVETGRMSLSVEPIDVSSVVKEAGELVAALGRARSIEVSTGRSASAVALADRQRLRQVVINLLSNAIKYNHDGGRVDVEVSAHPDYVQIAITDDGPGIAPEMMDRLFTPFDRLGAEETGVEGTGLGLPLARGLVEAMGGTLTATSAPGEGSTFTVKLAPALIGPADVAVDADHTKTRVIEGVTGTVLYIDDNVPNVELVKRLLRRRPLVELLVAGQGSAGFDLARQHHPDLILLDIHLPDLRGDEVLQRLKDDPSTDGIPVVIVSADATPDTAGRFKALGVVDYLTKPLDLRRFLQVVDSSLVEP